MFTRPDRSILHVFFRFLLVLDLIFQVLEFFFCVSRTFRAMFGQFLPFLRDLPPTDPSALEEVPLCCYAGPTWERELTPSPSLVLSSDFSISLSVLLCVNSSQLIMRCRCPPPTGSIGFLRVFRPQPIIVTDASSTPPPFSKKFWLREGASLLSHKVIYPLSPNGPRRSSSPRSACALAQRPPAVYVSFAGFFFLVLTSSTVL